MPLGLGHSSRVRSAPSAAFWTVSSVSTGSTKPGAGGAARGRCSRRRSTAGGTRPTSRAASRSSPWPANGIPSVDSGLRDPAAWAAQVAATDHVCARVGGSALCPPLLGRPALSLLVGSIAGAGWLAVGDAAATFDPLCSHGITKALADGLNAGAALADSLAGAADAQTVYSGQIAARWGEYCCARDELYHLEQRWPDALFWRRRCQRAHCAPSPDGQLRSRSK